jgi:alpha-tubulin suppressor-like RCC1 family protein
VSSGPARFVRDLCPADPPIATDIVETISAGGIHCGRRRCAVRRTGEVACWSMGEAFELRARPIAGLRDVVALSDGGWHACARLRDGTVRCWGKNSCGQLGDGTVVARPLPGVAVPVRDVEELSAGLCHTCARTRAGEVWCWGRHEAHTAPPRWREEFTPVVGLPAP